MKKDQKRKKIVVVDTGASLEKSPYLICCYSPYFPLR